MEVNGLHHSTPGVTDPTEPWPGVCMGRLMRPEEVVLALASRPEAVRSAVGGSWTLCGELSRQVFSWLQTSGLCGRALERLTAFVSPAGGTYAVLTQQAEAFQHRFLLPLYEPSVRAFVTEIGCSSLAYSLACARGSDALVWRSRIAARHILPLQTMAAPLAGRRQLEVMREYGLVVHQMTVPSQIPSLTAGKAVRDVSVTLLVPGETLRQCVHSLNGGQRD